MRKAHVACLRETFHDEMLNESRHSSKSVSPNNIKFQVYGKEKIMNDQNSSDVTKVDTEEGAKLGTKPRFRTDFSTLLKCKTKLLNVFQGAIKIAGRNKYTTSHYSVDLSPNTITDPISLEEDMGPVLPLGGVAFHERVREAAKLALSQSNFNQTSIESLVKATYAYLFNSRVMYALYLTAIRCQNVINIQDQNKVNFGPVLCNHVNKTFNKGWSATSFADEVSNIALGNDVTRTGYCFGSPTSNGYWNNKIVSPVVQNCAFPSESAVALLKLLFHQPILVKPTDFESYPNLVVFWPDATIFDYDAATGNFSLINFDDYIDHSSSAKVFPQQASITQLAGFFNTCKIAQLKIYQGNQALEDVLTRIKAFRPKTPLYRDQYGLNLEVRSSFDVTKLIHTAAVPAYQVVNSAGTAVRLTGGLVAYWGGDIFIERDPQIKFNSIKTDDGVIDLGQANAQWKDSILAEEGLAVYLHRVIAPLNISHIVVNSSNAAFMWTTPASILSDTAVNGVNMIGGFASDNNLFSAICEDTARKIHQGAVLPRGQVSLTYNTATAVTTYGLPTTYFYLESYLSNKNFQVKQVDADALKQEIADQLANCK